MWVAVGRELLEVDSRGVKSRLLPKLAPGSLFKVFLWLDKTAGECPAALERLGSAPHGQDAQTILQHGKQHEIDSHGKGRVRTRNLPGHSLILAN